jgi:hypothetical protein
MLCLWKGVLHKKLIVSQMLYEVLTFFGMTIHAYYCVPKNTRLGSQSGPRSHAFLMVHFSADILFIPESYKWFLMFMLLLLELITLEPFDEAFT